MSDSVQPYRRQPNRLLCPRDSPGKNTGVSCHFLLQCMKVKSESGVAQSCPTFSDPMDCSLPGSSVHGIFQARVLEWVAIAFFAILWLRSFNCMISGQQQGPHELLQFFEQETSYLLISILFYIVAVLVCLPTNNVRGFLFLCTLSSTVCRLFDSSHSDQCEMVPHCGFDLHF